MRVLLFTVSYPPDRFIGSELMDHRLLKELQRAGHSVAVHAAKGDGSWVYDGVPVVSGKHHAPPADVVMCHPDYGRPAREYQTRHKVPLVVICHNALNVVRIGLATTMFDLCVVNSAAMRDKLKQPTALVVHPPAPEPAPLSGDMVTVVSLNGLKGGDHFWAIAEAMPDTRFLAVKSGYGWQVAPENPPPNVEVLEHVPAERMDELVWSRTGVFLQLSSSESWGMAAAEATAHGIPVIAHPTPGLRENLGYSAEWIDREHTDRWVHAIRNPRDPGKVLRRAHHNHQTSRRQLAEWVKAISGLESHDVPTARNGS